MAQPPESTPLRLQSSLDLPSVEPRAQPDLDAFEKHHHGEPHHQQQTLQSRQSAQTSHPNDPSTGDRRAHLARNSGSGGGGHSPGVGEGKGTPDGVSAVNARPNIHASAASPVDTIQGIHGTHGTHGIQSEAQNGGGDAPVLKLPDMSNTQPPAGPPRQPVTYASPAPYPPAGMPPVSHYVYPQAPPAADPYRPTPTALPSMRTLDHRQPQAQSQHGLPLGAHMAAPMTPASAPPPMGYYGVHPHAHMYGLPDPSAMRFALAPGLAHDPRIALSGGRHKKEIKRRTKTGCLTCRKRRIKCDEAHPTCNNCKKSKRECLGYDPIFKQQQGPAAIQPAPTSQPSASATVVPTPTVPSSSAPHPYQTSYPPSLSSSLAFDPTVSTPPQSVKSEPGFDYSTAIDPALQGPDAPSAAGTRPPPQYQQNNAAASADQATADANQLRAKKMKVDELIALGGVSPPVATSSPPPSEILDEITKLYYEVYVPGLTLFFETQWYDFAKNRAMTAYPAAMIHNDKALVSLFASFLQTISAIKSTDPVDMVHSGHLESYVIWSLARLPLSATSTQPQSFPESVPAEDDLREARGRLHVFETLLSGETLACNPLSPPPATNINPLRKSELEFWYHLAKYLLLAHASAEPAHVSARENCLSVMRSLLDGRENRDVLYSIAVLREYTAHWDAAWNEQNVPSHLEESDSRSKLAVATRFIRDESTSTGGTTNVVRRFADLAFRAFVRPGVNVSKNRKG
ncbi:Negative acting factor [Madurella fahalii]|uniref:Negative acting factor n=1 Tax=Madurella fahalii TaxID=1157608 RepID=A0ABQ0GLH8_9PEZI